MPRMIVRKTARNVRPLSIGLMTGAHGQSRFAFKQLVQTHALDLHRTDGCRRAYRASPAQAG